MRRTNCCWAILSCLALFCITHVLYATDTLTVGQVMQDGEFLESSDKRFQLLFFSPEGYSRYLLIQYMQMVSVVAGRVQEKLVWVANRGNPLRGNLSLSISHNGNLVLTDYNGISITINDAQPASSGNTSATLLDTGNLILTEGSRIVWQSFDYPSDTWLPGMKLGLFNVSSSGQQRNQFLASWVSEQVATLGAFTLGVDPNDTKQLVIWKRGVIYWRSGIWNGYNFSFFPGIRNSNEFNFSYFSNENHSYFTFNRTDYDSGPWISIDSSGKIQIYKMGQNFLFGPTNYCDDTQAKYRTKGCVAPEPSNCTIGDVFNQTSGSMSIWRSLDNYSLGITDCEDICRRDCSCTAYASARSDGSGCEFSDGYKSTNLQDMFYIRTSTMAKNGLCFKSEFPLLYNLTTDKEGSLQYFYHRKSSSDNWNFQFRRELYDWELLEEIRLVNVLSSSPPLCLDRVDCHVWANGSFSVSALYSHSSSQLGPLLKICKFVWYNALPPKVFFFGWLAWKNRLKTAEFLHRLGILGSSASILCPFCSSEVETAVHVLLHCPFSWCIWSTVIQDWGFTWCIQGSVEGLFYWWMGGKLKRLEKKIWKAIPLVVLWSLWKRMNECVFSLSQPNSSGLYELIKIRTVLWLKATSKEFPLSVDDYLFKWNQIRC